MMNRRDFAKLVGTSSLAFPVLTQPSSAETTARGQRFLIHLCALDGMNAAYFFDARPLAFTAAGKIQNFLGEDPRPWVGRNGRQTLATRITNPLRDLSDYFTIINGVMVAIDSDGHDENFRFSVTSSTVGGTPFYASLRGQALLDGIQTDRELRLRLESPASVLSLEPSVLRSLAESFAQNPNLFASTSREGLFLNQAMQRRAAEQNAGEFSRGSLRLYQGFHSSGAFAQKIQLASAGVPDTPEFSSQLTMVTQVFRAGLSSCAMMKLGSGFMDYHDGARARTECEEAYSVVVRQIAETINHLRNTPVDPKNSSSPSFLDVTTFVVTSEFNRTMRQLGRTMEDTGTDHNTFGTSVLIGGAGIRCGDVIGATDLDAIDARGEFTLVSDHHRLNDRDLIKVMGKPFDYRTGTALEAGVFRGDFKKSDYLAYESIINTVHRSFGVPEAAHWKAPGQDGVIYPAIPTLLR